MSSGGLTNVVERRDRRLDILYWSLVCSLVAVWLWLGLSRLGFFSWEDDEGTFLLTARAVFQGQRLYHDVWFNYFPGLIYLLKFAFRLGGVSVSAARSAIMVMSSLLLVGQAELGRRLTGRFAGVAAALLLLVTAGFVRLGRSAMAEVPAAALTSWAIVLLLEYMRVGKRAWLAGAGLLIGLAVSFKYPVGIVALPMIVALGVWARREHRLWGALLVDVLTLGVAAAIPLLAMALAHGPALMWQQIVLPFLASRAIYTTDRGSNAAKVYAYLHRANLGLVVLFVSGTIALAWRDMAQAMLCVLWVVLYAGMMLFSAPLSSHHLLLLLPPLALLAAVGLQQGLSLDLATEQSVRTRLIGAMLVLGVLVYGWNASFMVRSTVRRLPRGESGSAEARQVITLIESNTITDAALVGDHPMLLFRTGRQVPSWLINSSGFRYRTSDLTEGDLLDMLDAGELDGVLLWENKLLEAMPGFCQRVRDAGEILYDNAESIKMGEADVKPHQFIILR